VGKDIWLVAVFAKLLNPISYLIIGEIIRSRMLGIDFIIINSETIARELVDKRSANYSTRPVIRTKELCALLVFIHLFFIN
jgi:hypothetical protein